MVSQNAKIQFYVFDNLINNSDMYLGPNQELNYATQEMITDYQHLNLKSEDKLDEIAESYQFFSDYLKNRGIQYYYFQCWDKHSIYPEYFPSTINQKGTISKTDQIVNTLTNNTSINVISPKAELVDAKSKYDTYSIWGDPSHWTQRGAYIGYLQLMHCINENNAYKYKILQENDYEIYATDQGREFLGDIHKKDFIDNFTIRNPQAYLSEEEPLYLSEWQNHSRKIYYNENANNTDTLLIIGDSYFDGYLYDDFAESFYKVVFIWGGYLEHIDELIEVYKPTIVITENAERCDRTENMISTVNKLREESSPH